ncbi:hypothetical protein FRC02_007660 [Tulasnella sp. 418]|nr:hypothetical protein FRC02_007660 [Tulasnella sp. 418]
MTSQQSETLVLNCLPQGEDGYGGFEVSVTLTSKVAVLKKAICEEMRMGWDPNDIDLWQVSIPIDDDKTIQDLKLKEQEGVTLLRSLVYLKRYFLSSPPQPEHIHIIVERRSAPRNALVGSGGTTAKYFIAFSLPLPMNQLHYITYYSDLISSWCSEAIG